MAVTAEMVKELRNTSGAGILDCKKALEETGGNMAEAVALLQKRNQAVATKKAERATKDGKVDTYIHGGGRIGVMVEVNCETDFVARSDPFKEFVHELCLQIAAQAPKVVSREDIPREDLDARRQAHVAEAMASGKPQQIADRIAEGKMAKWFQEFVLLEQAYIRDEERTIKSLLTDVIGRCGENVKIRRFVRFELGEGM